MRTTLAEADLADETRRLLDANREFSRLYPGESGARQPVHTVYGGAHLFKADAAPKLGKLALGAFRTYAPDPNALAEVLDLDRSGEAADDLAQTIHQRVERKLQTEPVEDFRIDFEDGFGCRPDQEEDFHARRAALEVAKGMADSSLPPFIGIRIKPFSPELAARSVRTLDIFLTTLVQETGGRLPENFVTTLPKVPIPEHVAHLAAVLEKLEDRFSLPNGSLKLELMIELTQSLFDSQGRNALPLLAQAAAGRCVAAHFGTYDYTASCSITAAHQEMTHPACDFAKQMMQVAFSGAGIQLSDGATNILPAPPHRAAAGQQLSAERQAENRRVVHRAWKLHVQHIRNSLRGGFYQGWDLHPAQLPTRFGTVFAFFLENFEAAAERLRNFVEKAAQATLAGDVFDDAATGQGLLNYFLRGINCGAISTDEALSTGLTLEEIRSRSFAKIMEGRRG